MSPCPIFRVLSLVLLLGQAAYAGGPKKIQETLAFHGDGVLDLDTVDVTKPVRITLYRDPGHFTRVLLPKSFGTPEGRWRRIMDEGVNCDDFKDVNGRKAYDLSLGSRSENRFRGNLIFQDLQGKAIILMAQFKGESSPKKDVAIRKLFAARGYSFPEDAGPAIEPTKPALSLLHLSFSKKPITPSDPLSVRKDANGFKVSVAMPLEVHSVEDAIVLPPGTEVVGTVRDDGRSIILAVDHVRFPDGATRDAYGWITLGKARKPERKESFEKEGILIPEMMEV